MVVLQVEDHQEEVLEVLQEDHLVEVLEVQVVNVLQMQIVVVVCIVQVELAVEKLSVEVEGMIVVSNEK